MTLMTKANPPRAARATSMLMRLLAAGSAVAALLLGGAPTASAQVPPPGGAPGEVDPPGRVGRLAEVQGQVWALSPESGEWVTAERNRVVTSGDRLATDGGARAELRIGSTTVRLDGGTELEMARLDDERIDLRVHSGSAALRIRNRDKLGEIAVLTGEGRFSFGRTGRYRIDRAGDASHLTVLEGQGLYEGPRSALTVYSGQRAEFWIDGTGVAQYAITDPRRDAFGSWTAERDRAEDASASARYVSPEMTGAEELDRHGRWQHNDEYGPLWVPYSVAPGWAPYSTGRWAWVRPWGWTWVDDAPWGFAPFHYGRWVWFGGSWCWAPGQRVLRPVFAPALVAWVGGPNFNLSINLGGGPAVGWFPLAPREVYVPAYRTSPVYVRNVNITHVTNITVINNAIVRPPSSQDLRNRRFPHAVTVVPANVVSSRAAVAPAATQLRDNPVVRQIVQSAVGTGAPANAFVPPVAVPAQAVRPANVAPPAPPGRVQPPGRAQGREERDATRDERRDGRHDGARDGTREAGGGAARGEAGQPGERATRDDRPGRDDRAARDDRAVRNDRAARDDRAGRDDASARTVPPRPVPPPVAVPRRPVRPADGAADPSVQAPARPRPPAIPAVPQRPQPPEQTPPQPPARVISTLPQPAPGAHAFAAAPQVPRRAEVPPPPRGAELAAAQRRAEVARRHDGGRSNDPEQLVEQRERARRDDGRSQPR